MRQDLTLVLGGTGKTGRRVAERLWARGVPTRLGSRAACPPFDWDHRATWAPALAGVGTAYVSYYPDLAVPGAGDTVGALAEQAVAAGVERLVLLSGRGKEEARRAERALAGAGGEWTVVRANWFAQNFRRGLPPGAHTSTAGWPCRSATCPSPSSTPTTSPTWRSWR